MNQLAIAIQNLPSYKEALELIRPQSLEESVNLWQIITGAWFPIMESYRFGYKAAILSNNNMPDIMVIKVIEKVAPNGASEISERQIMLVECKRPSLDKPREWDMTTTGQFQDDLHATLNASSRLYGAVAIGTRVRFYQFDGKNGASILYPLHPQPLDVRVPGEYQQVMQHVDHIKQNGWQWASS